MYLAEILHRVKIALEGNYNTSMNLGQTLYWYILKIP